MVFSLPNILKDIKNKVERKNNAVLPDYMQFSIYGSVIPDVEVPGVEVPYGGQVLKVSSHTRPSFPTNTINFTVDNMFNNYWVIYKWLQLLHSEKEGLYKSKVPNDTGFLKNYETTVSIFGLDEYNNRVIEFKYHHAFPVKLGGINYSDRDPNEIESSFEYSYHQFEAILL
jgi:hypothetical protein